MAFQGKIILQNENSYWFYIHTDHLNRLGGYHYSRNGEGQRNDSGVYEISESDWGGLDKS